MACVIASDKDGSTHFKFELTPKVEFENGKATRAHARWGKIEAPVLIKSALWTATAADNTVNLLFEHDRRRGERIRVEEVR